MTDPGTILSLVGSIITVAETIARQGGDAEAALRAALGELRRTRARLEAIEAREDTELENIRDIYEEDPP
jgi:hypothetical protein